MLFHLKTVEKTKHNLLENLHEQLLEVLDKPERIEVNSVFIGDHDYSSATDTQCIVYYLGGFVARRLIDGRCKGCTDSLANDKPSLHKASHLTEIKSKGFLIHPTQQLYKLLMFLESVISDHLVLLERQEIYFDITTDILADHQLNSLIVGCQSI